MSAAMVDKAILLWCRWQQACMERDTAREAGQEQLTVISELQVRLNHVRWYSSLFTQISLPSSIAMLQGMA